MARQPNIVVILADHVAFAGHYGTQGTQNTEQSSTKASKHFDYRWPNLEAIAKQGAWFDSAYAITPVCTPSRASFLTGKRPDKHGLRWNSEYPIADNRQDFRDDEQLYCHHLQQVGYENYYFGKWHCGVNKTATDYGMTGWSLPEYGNVYASEAYSEYLAKTQQPRPHCHIDHHLMRPKLDGTSILMQPKEPWDYMDSAGILSGTSAVHEQQFVANMAIEELKRLEQEPTNQPFSMVISLWGPHHPYYPSAEFANLVDPETIAPYPSFSDDLHNKPMRYHIHRDLRCQFRAHQRWNSWHIWQKVLARCYASGLQTDAAIGAINTLLQDTGLADNTLFIVTADHGDAIASHGGCWDKYSAFAEEVARIPLVMRWPKHIAAGTRVASYVNLLDVHYTMLDAAKAIPQVPHPLALDGESLLPFTSQHSERQSMICDHFGHSGDIRFQKILYDRGWKYVSAWADGDELYHLATDPYERHNKIDDVTTYDRQQHMRDTIIAHMEQRRQERSAWHRADFLEDGIVLSSPEWPREETLLLYKLKQQNRI